MYKFHPADGQMVLLNIAGDADEVINPAFSRFHPRYVVVVVVGRRRVEFYEATRNRSSFLIVLSVNTHDVM